MIIIYSRGSNLQRPARLFETALQAFDFFENILVMYKLNSYKISSLSLSKNVWPVLPNRITDSVHPQTRLKTTDL